MTVVFACLLIQVTCQPFSKINQVSVGWMHYIAIFLFHYLFVLILLNNCFQSELINNLKRPLWCGYVCCAEAILS